MRTQVLIERIFDTGLNMVSMFHKNAMMKKKKALPHAALDLLSHIKTNFTYETETIPTQGSRALIIQQSCVVAGRARENAETGRIASLGWWSSEAKRSREPTSSLKAP